MCHSRMFLAGIQGLIYLLKTTRWVSVTVWELLDTFNNASRGQLPAEAFLFGCGANLRFAFLIATGRDSENRATWIKLIHH